MIPLLTKNTQIYLIELYNKFILQLSYLTTLNSYSSEAGL